MLGNVSKSLCRQGHTPKSTGSKSAKVISNEPLNTTAFVPGNTATQEQDEVDATSTPMESLPNNSTPSEDTQLTEAASPMKVSRAKGVTVIVTLAGISFLNTMGSGILIAALPRIASDVGLSDGLILWPAAVYALAAGCLLLIFGAAADAIGAKIVWIVGSYLFFVFTIALGLAQTGLQVILFRTFLGVAISMCLPTAVSLITNTFPKGTWRNVAFAMNGMGQPLGFSLGLVLGGVFTDSIGWRWAYFMMSMLNFCLSTASIWSLPVVKPRGEKRWTRRLAEDIDWIGAALMVRPSLLHLDSGISWLIFDKERWFGSVALCIGDDYNLLYEHQKWRKYCLSRGFAGPARRLPRLDELPDATGSTSFDPEQIMEKCLVYYHMCVSFLLLGIFERD